MWATCATQVSRFLLSLKTAQNGLPFRRQGTPTVDQIVRVDRENHLDCEVELSPFQETSSGEQLQSAVELFHYKATADHTEVPPPPPTANEERPKSFHQDVSGWCASLFRTPSRYRHVEIDADAASRWVVGEDRGPGMQESQIGRYDAWL
jgi:hypothetical protein